MGVLILNSKHLLDKYIDEGINTGKHLGLSFGVYSQGETSFWNYGSHNNEPISEDHYFELASTGKIFTSILILKLENMGLLSIEDYIEQFLIGFPIKGKIKIRELLTHTSGLPESPENFKFIAPKNSYFNYSSDMFLKDLKEVSVDQDKFGAFNYSNYNYLILGEIVKSVMSDRDYLKILSQEILIPLGLKTIKPHLSDMEINEKLIIGHDQDLSAVPPYLDLGDVYSSTGALKATVRDLLLFSKMLIGKAQVPNDFSKIIKKLMLTSKDKIGNDISLGFHIRSNEQGITFYHPGSIAGNKCSLVVNPTKELAQVYVSTTLNHVRILWDIFYSK